VPPISARVYHRHNRELIGINSMVSGIGQTS
jgi:hypothetical protein